MPKKGKVNKLARMSDEERARYLQHRADMEEEARRRKIELIARFIKNKLDKEETYSRMNTAKLNQSWRYILRTVKCDQMALDIKGIQNSFNFLMEKKDRLLNGLMQAIEDADEQHRRCFQAHTENLSYFLSIGSDRLEKLQNEYEHQKNSLLENWDKDYYDIGDNQNKSEYKLQLIIFIQNSDFKNYKHLKELQDSTAKNDARLEHQEEMWDMRRPKQLQVEYYWHQLREVYQTYLESHGPYMQHYHTLLEKDQFYQRDMARNDILIQKATESLMKLQNEWIETTSLSNYKIIKMNKKKEELTKKYSQLRKFTKMEQLNNIEYLTNMVQGSQDAIKRLEEAKTKLNKILQMAEICKKFEIEEDHFTGLITEARKDDQEEYYEHLNSDMIDEYKEYSKLDKFFHKLNTVRIQNMCLKAEKIKLQKENAQIKIYIKRYLTELALKNGTEHGRPFSVKLKTEEKKLTGVNLKMNRPVTCIEGVLSNAVQHEKRMKILERKHKEIGGIQSFPRVQCWM